MASTINASTTSTTGLVYTADASGILQLQSNGTTALTVDTAANVTLAANLTVGSNISSTNITTTGRIVAGTQECAQLGMSATYTLPNNNIVQVPFDTVVISQGMTLNATNATVGGIEAYSWKHSTTGIFRLQYLVRSPTDVWNMISVVKNANTATPVGSSLRTGATNGQNGPTLECFYRVTNTTDRFSLYHWAHASMGTMATFATANPASTFFVTPDSGVGATSGTYYGYYNSIVITRV